MARTLDVYLHRHLSGHLLQDDHGDMRFSYAESWLGYPTATSPPTAFSFGSAGSSVVMIGYGGGVGETWGKNIVTQINYSAALPGTSYVTNDFLTVTGTTSYGSRSINNTAQVVSGDSGGGDFIFNSSSGKWELAGINEVTGTTGNSQSLSGFVQISSYAAQIEGLAAVPEPASWVSLSMGGVLLWGLVRSRQRCRE